MSFHLFIRFPILPLYEGTLTREFHIRHKFSCVFNISKLYFGIILIDIFNDLLA